MRKSILIGVLAALMLFAFTACENSASTYKIPVGITAEASNTEYLVGEYTDPSTITAAVRFSDGSTQTFTGTQLGIPAQKTSKAEVLPVTVAYGASYGVSSEGKPEATGGVGTYVNLYVYSVDSAAISNLPTTAAYDGKIDTTGVAVTVTYNHGKTRTLTADEFTFEASVGSDQAGKQDVAVSTKTLKVFGQNVTTLTGLDDWKVDVAKSATTEYNADDFAYAELVITGPDGKVFKTIKSNVAESNAIALSDGYIGDEYTFAFNLVSVDDESNEGRTVATLNKDYFFVDGVAPTGNKVSLAYNKDSSSSPAATYKVKFADAVANEFTITVGWGENYAIDITSIVPATASESAPSYEVGKTNKVENFIYTVKLAGGEPVEVITGTSEYITVKLLDPTVKNEALYNPRFEITYGKADSDGKQTTKLFYLDKAMETTPAGDNANEGETK